MKTRNSVLCALGLAAAITIGGAATAAAQGTDTTGRARSQTRIPVRKEAPVQAAPRVDTVTVTRTDTVVMRRSDTVTVTRVDTVTRIEELPLQPLLGWQFGIGVGMDVPTANWLHREVGTRQCESGRVRVDRNSQLSKGMAAMSRAWPFARPAISWRLTTGPV